MERKIGSFLESARSDGGGQAVPSTASREWEKTVTSYSLHFWTDLPFRASRLAFLREAPRELSPRGNEFAHLLLHCAQNRRRRNCSRVESRCSVYSFETESLKKHGFSRCYANLILNTLSSQGLLVCLSPITALIVLYTIIITEPRKIP